MVWLFFSSFYCRDFQVCAYNKTCGILFYFLKNKTNFTNYCKKKIWVIARIINCDRFYLWWNSTSRTEIIDFTAVLSFQKWNGTFLTFFTTFPIIFINGHLKKICVVQNLCTTCSSKFFILSECNNDACVDLQVCRIRVWSGKKHQIGHH